MNLNDDKNIVERKERIHNTCFSRFTRESHNEVHFNFERTEIIKIGR